MKRRVLSIALCLTMVLTLFVPMVYADYRDSKIVDVGDSFSFGYGCQCNGDSGWTINIDGNCVSHMYNNPANGEIGFRANEEGTAYITVECVNCGEKGYYDVKVNGTQPKSIGLYLDTHNMTLKSGSTGKLDAYWDAGSTVNISWSSSNSSVASVYGNNGSAVITANSEGSTIITVSDSISGESDKCYVYVKDGEYTLTLTNPSSAVYNVGDDANYLSTTPTLKDGSGNIVDPTGITYQWYKGSSSSGCTTKISGETSSSYLPSTNTAGTVYYSVTATYSVGSVHVAKSTIPVAVIVYGSSYALQITSDYSSLRYDGETDLTATLYYNAPSGKMVVASDYVTVSWSVSNASSYGKLDKSYTTGSSGRHYNNLHYAYRSSSSRTCTVKASVYVGGQTYSATKDIIFIGTGESESAYKVVLAGSPTTLSTGQSASITASVYQDGSLITKTNPNIIWTIRNGSDIASLSSTSTYAQGGYSSNTLTINQAVNYTRTVSVVASMTVGSSTYTASKDFTIKASTSYGHNIECYGMSMGNMNVPSEITAALGNNVSYVQFTIPSLSVGKLYADAGTGVTYGVPVSAVDKYYINGSGSLLSNVFFVPAADCATSISVAYNAYSSGGSYIGNGTVSMTVAKHTASAYFSDVTAAWCADAVDYMSYRGLVNGISANTFGPGNTMTKGMLITILYRSAGSPSVAGYTTPFVDLNPNYYYYNAVLWAYNNDYASGVTANTFGPNNMITREEIADILWRYKGRPVITTSYTSKYYDSNQVGTYYTSGVNWCLYKGILRGNTDNKLHPQDGATRAEVSVMLHRFFTE